jgi:hypothetical protein
VVSALQQVLPAGGNGVQVGDLVGGMAVAGCRYQIQCQRVVVGRNGPAIAADERQRRTAFALAGWVLKITHNHPERVEIPVQGTREVGSLQHHVAEAPAPVVAVGSR